MPNFHFAVGNAERIREAGQVHSDSFDDALEAITEQAELRLGDTLEIGVPGFPPARYTLVRTGKRSRGWRAANSLAA